MSKGFKYILICKSNIKDECRGPTTQEWTAHQVEWSDPILPLKIDVTVCSKELLHDGRMPLCDRDVEWRVHILVLKINVTWSFNHLLSDGRMPMTRRTVERCDTTRVLGVGQGQPSLPVVDRCTQTVVVSPSRATALMMNIPSMWIFSNRKAKRSDTVSVFWREYRMTWADVCLKYTRRTGGGLNDGGSSYTLCADVCWRMMIQGGLGGGSSYTR